MASFKSMVDDKIHAAKGLWNNKNVISKFALLKKNLHAKGYDENVFTFLGRVIYIVKTLPVEETDVKGLITIGYAHFVRKQIVDAIQNGNPEDYLQMDFNNLTSRFLDMMYDEIGVGGRFNNWRRRFTRHNPAARESNFERGGRALGTGTFLNENFKGLMNKIRKVGTGGTPTYPIPPGKALDKVRTKDILARCQKVNKRLMRIMYDAFYAYLKRYSTSLKTSIKSPERRRDEIYRRLTTTNEFGTILKNFFDNLYFQDEYFSIFRQIYIPEDKT